MPRPSRSRSPKRGSEHRNSHRNRSKSPHAHSSRHHDRRTHKATPDTIPQAIRLPMKASPISKDDYPKLQYLFGLYLDVQKQIFIEDLEEREIRGRWKSFVKKWNRAELSEGWYDPETLSKANASAASQPEPSDRRPSPTYEANKPAEESDSEDDDFGPAAPGPEYYNNRKSGPGIPNRSDLEHRDELNAEDTHNHISDLRTARKSDRRAQKERLEELVPRAEPGSRERQLEKKREVAAANRSFRDAKSPGAEEVREGDLLGDDGIDAYKSRRKEDERKKNEREVRREEQLRTRMAEREEKMAEYKAKEDKTMDMLKALAKQRFG